ncbi:hypothetical protein CAI21_08865 [Alkalilimnicola ehrlichii]|uniref:DUF2382 domain-containing protein n=1 Tax=Alkalilimnicola ehrlichii TaxID=351052 RepID=A0A3E0WWY8_9GAMM|nr:DUF2382 domain-containing protein [Alkalilimnicola ehrlichii]RFA29927.1 hypothetical protein CAI21_08865 [Alkalilimnicola ehrlichii]RFA36515.1 hypothetical protein CAL65_11140 [Alkalilimnicola ehrlichii]
MSAEQDPPRSESEVIPVVREELDIQKRERETDRVLVTKQHEETLQHVEEPLFRENVEVTRIPKNELIQERLAVRTEGDTTIIPVIEEEIVLEKRLVLREEVHVTRTRNTSSYVDDIPIKTEKVTVERGRSNGSSGNGERGVSPPGE